MQLQAAAGQCSTGFGRTSTSGSPSARCTSSGAVERGAREAARRRATSSRQDGAVWLRTTDFGDDKDRVLVKANGELTYFASDTAYYVDKRARGFDLCIYLLGADHHGYVGRLRAVAACAGDDPDAQHRGAHRPAGEDGQGWRGGAAVASGPATSSRSRTSSTRSASTPPATRLFRYPSTRR